ncbi:MAG: hypothetical protein ACI9OH_000864 [Oleispira sp.]|jgi:hypothetical protein
MKMNVKKNALTVLGLGLISLTGFSYAADYEWNANVPVKVPTAQSSNGKTVLFDVSHGGTEGNADWVIDGGFSDFADALVAEGYRVEEYRGIDLNNDGLILYADDLNTSNNSQNNEAIITYSAIQHADVLVLAESNRPFKISEYQALEQFVAAGKGIYFVGDHYNADRNLNTWDSTEVFNGYNRSTLAKYNYAGEYGDLRNPGNGQGWLAQNFGIRFRFNAVDYKAGVSDITAPVHAEGVTQGVGPILMAGGATLAITDSSKAKGLVYLSAQDNATAWGHAVDAGLYFGGRDEGPYVAIAKAGLGKAAFIGDSSPVEDATPKYRRQDSGSMKKTYPGWTDPGDAATLSVNIINWLATPESYTAFDNNNGHTAGELTPNAKAATEMDDPDHGNPWSTPNNGYNPNDPSTFANGAYAARLSVSGDGGSPVDPDPTDPPTISLSVTEALTITNGTGLQLVGTVTEAVNGIYGLKLNDLQAVDDFIFIKLDSQFRDEFNPQLNPAIVGETILVTGVKNDYMSQPGVRDVSAIEIVASAIGVSQALSLDNGSDVILEGIVSAELNGIYALLLSDINDANISINVKLESSQRAQFSPQLNPAILQHKIRVTGTRNDYMSQPGVRDLSEIIDLGLVDAAGEGEVNNYSSVSEALAVATGTALVVSGFVVEAVNGIYGLLLQDINDSNKQMNVKLESEFRDQFNPQLNPSIIGAQVIISGKRDAYMGQPGIRYIESIDRVN